MSNSSIFKRVDFVALVLFFFVFHLFPVEAARVNFNLDSGNYYERMGVEKNSTSREIEAKYNQLKELSDSSQNLRENFAKIEVAYRTLIDHTSRYAHNDFLKIRENNSDEQSFGFLESISNNINHFSFESTESVNPNSKFIEEMVNYYNSIENLSSEKLFQAPKGSVEAKKNYRRLMSKYHPDRYQNPEEISISKKIAQIIQSKFHNWQESTTPPKFRMEFNMDKGEITWSVYVNGEWIKKDYQDIFYPQFKNMDIDDGLNNTRTYQTLRREFSVLIDSESDYLYERLDRLMRLSAMPIISTINADPASRRFYMGLLFLSFMGDIQSIGSGNSIGPILTGLTSLFIGFPIFSNYRILNGKALYILNLFIRKSPTKNLQLTFFTFYDILRSQYAEKDIANYNILKSLIKTNSFFVIPFLSFDGGNFSTFIKAESAFFKKHIGKLNDEKLKQRGINLLDEIIAAESSSLSKKGFMLSCIKHLIF